MKTLDRRLLLKLSAASLLALFTGCKPHEIDPRSQKYATFLDNLLSPLDREYTLQQDWIDKIERTVFKEGKIDLGPGVHYISHPLILDKKNTLHNEISINGSPDGKTFIVAPEGRALFALNISDSTPLKVNLNNVTVISKGLGNSFDRHSHQYLMTQYNQDTRENWISRLALHDGGLGTFIGNVSINAQNCSFFARPSGLCGGLFNINTFDYPNRDMGISNIFEGCSFYQGFEPLAPSTGYFIDLQSGALSISNCEFHNGYVSYTSPISAFYPSIVNINNTKYSYYGPPIPSPHCLPIVDFGAKPFNHTKLPATLEETPYIGIAALTVEGTDRVCVKNPMGGSGLPISNQIGEEAEKLKQEFNTGFLLGNPNADGYKAFWAKYPERLYLGNIRLE